MHLDQQAYLKFGVDLLCSGFTTCVVVLVCTVVIFKNDNKSDTIKILVTVCTPNVH